MDQLLQFIAGNRIDVALTLRRTSDFAAVQWRRREAESAGAACWPELSEAHRSLADRLGGMAARSELAVFAGAGVSKPIGFPDWGELLRELGGESVVTDKTTDFPRLAQSLAIADLEVQVADRFQTHKHALGHALLADLRTPSTVTTNYDPCLENATEILYRNGRPRVLARELAVGGQPWILKLHGDVQAPKTIVLTSDQYERMKGEWGALRGLVQSLMLTSHLLFVGFGFAEDDFLAMSEAVQRVRALAADVSEDVTVGTALSLRSSEHTGKYSELSYEHMASADTDIGEAARLLEVFLDRLAWRAQVEGEGRAAYLLDPDYFEGATADDRAVRGALLTLKEATRDHSSSAGHSLINDLFLQLGFREAPDERTEPQGQ